MVARHHWTIEPGIVGRPHYAFIDALRGPADGDNWTVRMEVQDTLGGIDFSI